MSDISKNKKVSSSVSKVKSTYTKTVVANKKPNTNNTNWLNNFFNSKTYSYIFASLAIIVLLIGASLAYLNITNQNDKDQALAATTPVSSFNPSDCATYVSNGGTNTAGVCFVKLYEKNGQLYKSLDITPGEIVKVRNYYNNTTTASVTAANITDSIPVGFTKIGSVTNNYVDGNPVTLNDNVFTGQNLSVAPGAGYFGYAGDNTVTTSNLELGKLRYMHALTYTTGCGTGATDTNRGYVFGLTFDNIATGGCTQNSATAPNIDTLGFRYMHALTYTTGCGTGASDSNRGYVFGLTFDNIATGGCTQNSATAPNIDTLGFRYMHALTYTTGCGTGASDSNRGYVFGLTFDNIATGGCTQNSATAPNIDLSDTTRGYGYISYSMQVPTTGVANGDQKGTIARLEVGSDVTRTSGQQSSLTITNVQSPNIAYTKLYSVDNGTTWSTNVTANPGQTVKVRLWSENTGGIAATSANIKDSLPNTFTYVDGSAKNCLNPSTTTITNPNNNELVCDTGTPTLKDSLKTALFGTTGVSPSAGLYDATGATVALGGTAFNAPAGVLEIGKKRYAQLQSDAQSSVGLSDLTCNLVVDNISTFTDNGFCPNRNQRTVAMKADLLGKRYAQLQSDAQSSVGLSDLTCNLVVDNISTFTDNGFCPNRNQRTVAMKADLLGKRYAQLQSDAQSSVGLSDLTCNLVVDNISTFTDNGFCPNRNQRTVAMKADLLDATRSKSYLQYEMIIPSGTASGNYGTQSTISSTATTSEFPNINSGAAGTGITVTGDPAFSVKKLLALPTSGTGSAAVCPTSTSSYSSTLSNTTPGATVCVRLAYQNKTSGAVSAAAITDTLPSGLTYITNSTSNCLTPIVGNAVCASDASQANTAWTGNNGWSGSNFALAPHAGLYGQSATGTSSIMEMGKKRFINQYTCTYTNGTDSVSGFGIFNVANIRENTQLCPNGTAGYTAGSLQNPFTNANSILGTDIFGKRKVNQLQCTYTKATDSTSGFQIYSATNTRDNTSICPAGDVGFIPGSTQSPFTNANSVFDFDILGNRFINQFKCTYANGIDSFGSYPIISVNNVSDTISVCPAGSSGYSPGSAQNPFTNANSVSSFDLLDPQNGTGYIQYKISTPTSPSSQSITLPNVSLAGTGQTTSTSNATINFTSTPLTDTDLDKLTDLICNSGTSVLVNSFTNCTFTLPTNKTLPTSPNSLKLGIGNSTPAGTCSTGTGASVNIVTCINVPTGSQTGQQIIYGQIGTGTKVDTTKKVTVIAPTPTISDTLFIPDTAITLTPNPVTTGLSIFGATDYTIVVKDDRMVTTPNQALNSSTAVCTYRVKELSAVATEANRGYTKLTSTIISPYNNGGTYNANSNVTNTPGNTTPTPQYEVNYNTGTGTTTGTTNNNTTGGTTNLGTSIKITKENQKFVDYNLEIRCKRNSDGQLFGRDERINFLFGAYSIVTVNGVVVV